MSFWLVFPFHWNAGLWNPISSRDIPSKQVNAFLRRKKGSESERDDIPLNSSSTWSHVVNADILLTIKTVNQVEKINQTTTIFTFLSLSFSICWFFTWQCQHQNKIFSCPFFCFVLFLGGRGCFIFLPKDLTF